MDPNQYNANSFNFMQNYQLPTNPNSQNPPLFSNSQTNPNANFQFPMLPPPYQFPMFQQPLTNVDMFYGSPMSTGGVQFTDKEKETNFMYDSQVPSISTNVNLENITLDKEEGRVTQRKSKARFTMEEDTLLIKAWLNVSNDAILEMDQKADSFWLKVKDNYNEYRGHLRERDVMRLKSRWHQLNSIIQKFVRCYKQVIHKKKSGSSENDIMAEAYAIFSQDEGEQFKLEYAWRLLKDEPKWTNPSFEGSTKRTKIYASRAYSSSSNSKTPISCDYDLVSPTLFRPLGNKTIKQKAKTKANETSSIGVDLGVIKEARKSGVVILPELTRITDESNKLNVKELNMKDLDILFKDTSGMTERQLQDHEKLCNIIRGKHGIV